MLGTVTRVTVVALTTGSLLSSANRIPLMPTQVSPIDSVVLERSSCYGSCPSYRLVIDTTDVVHLTSLSAADSGKQFTGKSARRTVAKLYLMARRMHFGEFPDSIEASPLCGPRVTDEQTVIIGVYGNALRKRVVHYRGCLWSPSVLFDFENAVDSLADSKRWISTPTPSKGGRPGRRE